MKNRVVVTGLGIISPAGNTIQEFWKNLTLGISGVDYVSHFDTTDFATKIAGEVKNFNPDDYINKRDVRRMDKFCHFALASAKQAVENSRLNISEHAEKTGVIVGCGIGGFSTIENQYKILLERGPQRVSPFTIPMIIPNIAGGYIAINYNAKGVNYCPVTACASSNNAIGDAFNLIKSGVLDYAICGGTESAITPLSFAGFCSARAMSRNNENPQKASRPFDSLRDGFVMGEGSGILILENLESALKRGAVIFAEIKGYATNCDAYHITSPDPEGTSIKNCMALALKNAELLPENIDYINAHGTSTELNDKTETLAIKEVFQDNKNLLVSSTKSITGHLLGASGAIEAIASILAIKNNLVPPTINYENPDPDCDLDYVPNVAREKNLNYVMSNSFGFGGHNASIVFSKFFD